jgi:ABC-2 type transport system permease protein
MTMSEFWLLLKANFINTLKINKRLKGNRSPIVAFILVLIGFSVFLGLGFLYMFIFGELFNELGTPEMILIVGISLGFILIIVMTVTVANSYLFRSRDFDLLMSLPVPTSAIVASKIAHMLLLNYLLFFVLYCPTIVVYLVYNEAGLIFYLLILPTFFLIPLLPITVSGLLSYLFGFIPLKEKYKTFFKIILPIAFILLYFFGQFLSIGSGADDDSFVNFGKFFGKFNYPGILAANGMTRSILEYLLFVAISVIPFVGFIYLIAVNYLKTNNRSLRSDINKKFVLKEMKGASQTRALIGKELRRYFSSSIYVVNTIVSPLMSFILLIMFIIFKNRMTEFDFKPEVVAPMLIAVFIFSLSLTSTTSSSISIEGKQFWILKSLPCSENKVFFAKIFVNLFITVPFLVVDVIIAIVALKISVLHALFVFLIPLLLLLFTSFTGLYVNLLFPRFDYENDTKVVKQSISVLVSMVCGVIATALLVGLGYLLIREFGNNIIVYLLTTLATAILALTSFLLLRFSGAKLYQNINS